MIDGWMVRDFQRPLGFEKTPAVIGKIGDLVKRTSSTQDDQDRDRADDIKDDIGLFGL
jgi:hypothetical protein